MYDFLKANLVSWDDLCKIALSIGKGLAFLHDEKGDCNSPDFKPAIAHRDFKSKNVLIKDDLTACISDFGLAMVLEPGFSNANSQVGFFQILWKSSGLILVTFPSHDYILN